MPDHSTELGSERGTTGEGRGDDEFNDVFLRVLGHDLRSPLAAILASARLAIRRGTLPLRDQMTISRIVSSGERMERMIGEILDLTRSRQKGGIPLRSEARDLSVSVSKAVDEAQTRFPDAVIEFSRAPNGELIARIDTARIEQVVSSLLGNAIRRSPAGRAVRVGVRSDEVYVMVSVHDDGQPIPVELHALFFDPFARARTPRGLVAGGLGVDLHIAEHLVRAHGGAIHLASSAVEGTTFSFSVLRAPEKGGAPR